LHYKTFTYVQTTPNLQYVSEKGPTSGLDLFFPRHSVCVEYEAW